MWALWVLALAVQLVLAVEAVEALWDELVALLVDGLVALLVDGWAVVWVFLSSLLAVWLAWWAGVPLVQAEVAQVVLVQVRLEEELVGLAAPPRAQQAPPLQEGAAGSWAS